MPGKVNIPSSICAVELFFNCIEVMEEARKKIYHDKEIEETSHPPPRNRRDMLRQIAVKRYRNLALQDSTYLEKCLEVLWNPIKDSLCTGI
jgi:hypothetical protein